MCLVIDKQATEQLLNCGKEEIACYKVLDGAIDGEVISPIRNKIWQPGINYSNSKVKLVCLRCQRKIYLGIHVYLRRKDAKKSWIMNEYLQRRGVIVKVKCQIADLIASDGWEAVFRKVILSKEEYNKAVGELTCVYQ